MQPIDHLFERVADFENLAKAYRRARKGISDKSEADIVKRHLGYEIFDILSSLQNETYKFGPYRIFTVRDPKERPIHVAPFRDRNIHHAINAVVEPIFEKSFIYDSYACRKGKGNLKALARLQTWLNNDSTTYALFLDVSKFFASIDRSILLKQISRYIADEKLMRLITNLINTAPSLIFKGRGLPIGNLTSQTFANLYLNDFDHFAKDYLGIKRYIRYVDDIVCLGSKDNMHQIRSVMKDYLNNRLNLNIAPRKDKVLLARNGITFLGFVLRPNTRPKLKQEAVKRFFRKMRQMRIALFPEHKIAVSVKSWFSYAKLANVDYLLNKADAAKYLK